MFQLSSLSSASTGPTGREREEGMLLVQEYIYGAVKPWANA